MDDLFINTIGGLVGHMITPLIVLFLPTSDELEEQSYQKGKCVTLLRRIIAFAIDVFILSAIPC